MARTRWFFPAVFDRARPGRTGRPAAARPHAVRSALERLEDRAVPAAFSNVLVDNPAADVGTNDTQSETALVLAGSTVLVAYNDSGSNQSNNKFTGFSVSGDGGATFADRGSLPTSTAGDAGDPALARDAVSGKIYL